MNKIQILYTFVTMIAILLVFLPLKVRAEENSEKAKMQKMAGINKEITGSYDESLAVHCHNGIYVGQAEGSVLTYKGIPFAEQPVGQLRWKDPVLAADREGVYEAKYFGKSPIQTEWFSEVGSYYLKGEDCLNLNVWVNTQDTSKDKTVMVFFHGGSFGWGGTSDPLYDGHNLVEKFPDVILVTAGYRTGIMGFIDFSSVPGGEDFTTSGNLGLLDQVCALKWVQKNIKAFGGNPDNVTIFGESAGGGSVSLLPLIEGTKGLFRRIIAESGSVCQSFSREESSYLTQMLLENSKCTNMEELMALSEEELMELNEDLNDSNNFPLRDGIVLPEDLYAAWENPDLADIDFMAGTNKDELRYWIRELGYDVPLLPKTSAYKLQMPVAFENVRKKMSAEEKKLTDRFMQMQKGEKIWKITEFYNELLFRVPALEQAVRHKGKSYNYYWTMPGADETLGSCHAVELAYVFNNPQADLYTGGLYDEKLADTTQNMWVNFARSGDPSTEEYAWEPYTSENRKTMMLGQEIGVTTDLMQEQQELIKPLLHHYFNGCYVDLDYNVPFLWKTVAMMAGVLALIIGAIVLIVFKIRK